MEYQDIFKFRIFGCLGGVSDFVNSGAMVDLGIFIRNISYTEEFQDPRRYKRFVIFGIFGIFGKISEIARYIRNNTFRSFLIILITGSFRILDNFEKRDIFKVWNILRVLKINQ